MSEQTQRSASRTARMVAAWRGRSSRGPDAVCDDPWATSLAGPQGEALADAYEKHFPAMELWLGLRTRFLDDVVRHALGQGVGQVVVLGAGLDTRAARLATEGVRFFEVDHAGSQAEKRERLATLDGYPLDAAVWVTCDFERDDFLDRLTAAGFCAGEPAIFVWEGVVYYLSRADVEATARRIAGGCAPGSRLLFDYVGTRMARGDHTLSEDDHAMRDFVAELGEPLRFGINDVLPLLHGCGFRHVRTISFDEIAASVTGTYERSRMFRFQHIASASMGSLDSPWG